MLENETALDAVVVSIPDHMHAPASVMAMQMGLHVYCEKPLTHSIHEARRMREVARRQGIATQMGNGGMASEGTRQSIEIIRAGDIGEVREIHVWTDRPIWPQGLERPSESQAVPSALDWNLWLGVAPERPYHEVYAPFVWRGWQDFGTGALGDIACHSVAMVYMALDLGQPERVRAVTSPRYRETFPNWSIITFEFPSRGKLPPCTLTWYDGGKHPPRELFLGEDFGSGGTLIVGSKGRLHGNTLLPRKDFEGYEPPEPTLPRVTGHHQEWIAACKGGAKPFSNFDFASQLTEAMLTGNLAIATNHEIAWDARRMRASNCREAASLIRPDYRPSFSL